MNVTIGLLIFIVGVLLLMLLVDTPTETSVEDVRCMNPFIPYSEGCCLDMNNDTVCDVKEEKNVTQTITLNESDISFMTDTFKWGLYEVNSCRNCASNPVLYDCSDLTQPLYYTCNIPDGQNQMACTVTLNGTKHNSTISSICQDDIISNKIFIKLDQVNNLQLCCILTYWNYPLQRYEMSNQVCVNATVSPPCDIV
ncbi:MAG: hypothetical protein ABIH52_03700 [Candidatus Aenigmatarchaeota archaeon]|nr:hypothetical protein [Nanoarchaeota archaeon]